MTALVIPGFTPTATQDRVWQAIEEAAPGTTTIIGYGGAVGGGKLLRLSTRVPTPDGWATMGALRAGDAVFDEHGCVCRVTVAHPYETPERAYRLVFDDGSTVESGVEHLWLTFDVKELASLTRRTPEWRAQRRESRTSRVSGRRSEAFTVAVTARNRLMPPLDPPTGTVRTTGEIVSTLRQRDGASNHAIPVTKALDLPDRELPIDPYLFGVWLGDGSRASGEITTMDAEIDAAFVVSAYPPGIRRVREGNRAWQFVACGLVTALRASGVLKNKHVPPPYLRASRAQRLALLQGLMDTDGTVTDSGKPEFTNTNRRIVDAVYEIIVSLGWKARVVEGRAKFNGVDHGPKWDIKWSPDDYVFRLSRKRSRQVLATRRTVKFRYIVDAFEIEPEPMRCITVDSPSHLYLVGDSMIPTHNTRCLAELAIDLALDNPGTKVLVARKDLVDLRTTTLEEFDRCCPRQLIVRAPDSPIIIREIRDPSWPRGVVSRVYFRDLKDWAGLGSEEFGAVLIEEAGEVAEGAAKMLVTRLRNKASAKYVFVAASNPWPGWFERWFIDRKLPEDLLNAVGATVHFIPAKIADNPHLPANYGAMLNAFFAGDEDWMARMVEGRFDSFEGQVYREITPMMEWKGDLPPFVRLVGGLDFGGANEHAHKTAGVVAGITASSEDAEKGHLIRLSHFEHSGPDVDDLLEKWMFRVEWLFGNDSKKLWIDWRADKTQIWGIEQAKKKHNIVPSHGGSDSVWLGIVQERGRMKDKTSWYVPELTQKPMLDGKALNGESWYDRMRRYRWQVQPDENRSVPGTPIKRDDDQCDADRYMVEEADGFPYVGAKIPTSDMRGRPLRAKAV